jgi:flagellar biosynthesis/type III secretory pathway chaperone
VPKGRGEDWTGGDQAPVEDLRAALRATLAELRALNDTNAALARRALASTEQALRLLQAALPATYEANGALRPGSAGVQRAWAV